MTAATVYDIGDSVEMTASFTNSAGVAANPTTVVCSIKAPDGTVTNSTTVTNTGVGEYNAVIDPTSAGRHYYRFVGTGTLKAAEENVFIVREQKVI